MTKIGGVNVIEPWGYDRLYPILQDAYNALFYSHQNLYTEKLKNPYTKPIDKKKWHLEDLITDDLIRKEELLPKSFDYRIVNQQKDSTKNTRIDIAVQWSLKFGHAYDIKIECKLLHSNNLNYIIDGGLKKFKNNQYSQELPLAAMLCYNTSGDIDQNIQNLNSKIEQKLSSSEKLDQFDIIEEYHNSFKSIHTRTSNTNIDIYTMVFDFREIILNWPTQPKYIIR